jgi:hypothetical protein
MFQALGGTAFGPMINPQSRQFLIPGRITMPNTLQRTFAAAMFAIICFALPASAQETLRIRGTIEKVDGAVYVVKNRDGAEVKLTVIDPHLYVAIVKSAMSDIKPGQFVGATGVTQPDGSQKAIEVHIFPESMRGTGEGHYDWDLKPNTKMTNANVEQTVAGVDGPVLTAKYKDGEKKIMVTPETQVVSYVIGDKADLKPGIKIFVGGAKKGADGTWTTPRVTYGKDGLQPPM